MTQVFVIVFVCWRSWGGGGGELWGGGGGGNEISGFKKKNCHFARCRRRVVFFLFCLAKGCQGNGGQIKSETSLHVVDVGREGEGWGRGRQEGKGGRRRSN